MNVLRWILAVGIVLLCVAWGGFFVVENDFRRSFGASPNNVLLAVIPIAAGLALVGWLIPSQPGFGELLICIGCG